jgi:hypothetical protein
MPHSHAAAAARQYADEAAAAAAASYGSKPSRHGSGHFSGVLPSVPDVPACSSSLPADYGSDEFLLDEQVQAMLVDVISQVGGELAAAAPASTAVAAELNLQQQQRNMVRRSGSLSRQMSVDTPYGRATGMPAAAAAAPAAALAPATPAGCSSSDAAADALAALNSYMLRHEQQKQRHQQCISAAAAAAALNVSGSPSGLPAGMAGLASLAGAAGLSRQAQAKLQELMAAQQMQLEIQMELLELLSAA